jgi:vacuolar-type H+-ATPase subunit D/Vma8
VRETLNRAVLQVGAWVNVVGYIMNGKSVAEAVEVDTRDESVMVKVQAIMLWDAVAIDLEQYEQAVQARKDAVTTAQIEKPGNYI